MAAAMRSIVVTYDGWYATLLTLTGTFNQVIALAAVLFVVNYLSAYVAVFRLRRTEPRLARPHRAAGYPWATGVAILGSLSILLTVIVGDPRSAFFAAVLLALSIPVRWWICGGSS